MRDAHSHERYILLGSIDQDDAHKTKLEKEKEELTASYNRYLTAHDAFKEEMDNTSFMGLEIEERLTQLVLAEKELGEQAEKTMGAAQLREEIALYQEKRDEVYAAFMLMKKQELFADAQFERMNLELLDLTRRIEDLDESIDYLVDRLFKEAVDLTEKN